MRLESQTHLQDDHVDRITDCSTRYGQAHAVSTRVSTRWPRDDAYERMAVDVWEVWVWTFKRYEPLRGMGMELW